MWSKITTIILLGTTLTGGYCLYQQAFSSSNTSPPPLTTGSNSKPTSNGIQPTLDNHWQQLRYALPSEQLLDQHQRLLFTEQSIKQALQAIRVDDEGNLVQDHTTLLSLDEALERLYSKMSQEQLLVLQQFVEGALPPHIGKQTAELIGNYYNYLHAKDVFSRHFERIHAIDGKPSTESLQRDELLYQELQLIRENHLGQDSSKLLFKVSDANAAFMFANMKLDADTSLTPTQKQDLRRQYREQYIYDSVEIENWRERYDDYRHAHGRIVATDLTQQQLKEHILALFNSTFTVEEQERIAHLGLTKLSGDNL